MKGERRGTFPASFFTIQPLVLITYYERKECHKLTKLCVIYLYSP